MPNFDTGHYFLTTLAPIKNGSTRDGRGVVVSYQQNLRMELGVLPTALQSPATVKIGVNSPFSRNRQTHLCRFMVMDDVIYNGRTRTSTLKNSILGRDPIQPQEIDRLNRAYLMFSADIDAVENEGDPLPETLDEEAQDRVRDRYARRLWDTMEDDLRRIYSNCEGFDKVEDADGFARYIKRCQVETTMPFNDYWISPPKLNNLPALPILAGVGIPLVLTVLGLLFWLFGAENLPILGWAAGKTAFFGAIISAIAIFAAYQFVMWLGNKPMPPGELADLPSVLKSLYTQQHFSEFSISMQGKSDAEIHEAFGAYVEAHDPLNTLAPSQSPGVISSAHDGGTVR